ncbi:MAG TPA: ABC transporter permease [Candidatus Acidoferrales bacterium]|nr:ABC transporter permease [Candidatus Acidoferrales bacterium]
MFFRILGESFLRNPARKWLEAAALALGMAITTAALVTALDVGDRMAREFRRLGANLVVTPKSDTLPLEIAGTDYRPVEEGTYLKQEDLGKLRTIFWRFNIVGFSPFLDAPAELERGESRLATRIVGTWAAHEVAVPDGTTFRTGVLTTHPWWKVEGKWFWEGDETVTAGPRDVVVGASLASRAGIHTGDRLTIRVGTQEIGARASGILTSGGAEDQEIVAPLWLVQQLTGHAGEYRRMLVSALTTPDNELAQRDPDTMNPTEYDRWFCTPYISSIAFQIKQALPGSEVRVVRQVAETEGRVLGRLSALLWLVSVTALVAAALVIGSTSATTVLERRREIGLMKALGAGRRRIVGLFVAEQAVVALCGGIAGYLAGEGLGYLVGKVVFGVPGTGRIVLLPVVMALAVAVTLAGSLWPLGRVARLEAAPVLRGE